MTWTSMFHCKYLQILEFLILKEGIAKHVVVNTLSFKYPKTCISKNLRKPKVFLSSGTRTLAREPGEAQDSSQEVPKDLQSLNKQETKNGPQNY